MKLKITEQEKKDILEQYQDEKILSIPDFKLFNYDWNLLMSFLNKRRNPKWKIMGDLDLSRNKDVTDLNNLVSVEGNLMLHKTPITSLGVLESVGGSLDLEDTTIKSLGNLRSVGRGLYLRHGKITSLGSLESVGGSLFLTNTNIKDFGILRFVGRKLFFGGTPGTKKNTKQEVEQKGNV